MWREKKLAKDREIGAQKRAEYRAMHPRSPVKTPEERRESLREAGRRFCSSEKGRMALRAARHIRYARLRMVSCEKITREQIIAMFDVQEWRCFYCKLETKYLEVEHVVPISRGGAHVRTNIVGACRACNISKNSRTLDEWTPPSLPQRELRPPIAKKISTFVA